MAQVVVELSADEQKLLNSYRKIQTEQNKVDAGHKKMTTGMNKFSKATQESERRVRGAKAALQGAFGSTAVAQLQQFALGMVGISSAISGVSKALQIMREDTQRALQVTEQLIPTGRKMSQIVSGDKREMLAAERMRLGKLTGVEFSRIEDLQFTAQSTGMSGEAVETITRAAGANVFSIETAGMVGSEIPLLFKGKATPYQAIAALSVAAGASPADFDTLAENLQEAAEGTNQQAGITPQETIAALAVMREKFKPATAAARINRFAANLAQDKRFEGMGLAESVRSLMAMSDEDRNKLTGDSIQMGAAYDALVKLLPTLEERTKAVNAAFETPTQILNTQISDAIDPSYGESARMRAWMERNKALREQEALSLYRAGQGGLEREAAAVRMQTQAQRLYIDPSQRVARRGFRAVLNDMNVSPQVADFLEQSPQERLAPVFARLFGAIDEMTDATRENTDAMNRTNVPTKAALGVSE